MRRHLVETITIKDARLADDIMKGLCNLGSGTAYEFETEHEKDSNGYIIGTTIRVYELLSMI